MQELQSYWNRVIPNEDFSMAWQVSLNETNTEEEAYDDMENYIENRDIEIQAASGF